MKNKLFLIIFVVMALFTFSCKSNNNDNNEQEEVEKYQVSFYDGENLLEKLSVKKGEAATPKTPTKTGYDFKNWDKDISNIQSDLIVNAVFEKKIFKVTFMYDEINVYKEINVEYDGTAIVDNPEREGYTFVDWDTILTNIKADTIVYGIFSVKTCKVTFYVDGVKYSEAEVDYGEKLNMKAHPRKDGYIFVGWDTNLDCVKEDLTVNGIYKKRSYVVTFLDYKGDILKEENVLYQEAATAPNVENDDVYDFVSWDTEFDSIIEDTVVTGIYKKTKFDIVFMVEDSVYEADLKHYRNGDEYTLPVPTLNGYDFLGWTLSKKSMKTFDKIDSSFTGDLTFHAYVVETAVHSPITLPNATAHFEGVHEVTGSITVTQPIIPDSVSNNSATAYNWTSSDTTIATVSAYSSISVVNVGYCIITATLKTDPSITINGIIHATIDGVEYATEAEANTRDLVNVTFVDKDNNVLSTQRILKGSSALLPTPPTVAGSAFVGWDHDNFNIKADTTFKPLYEEGKINKYVGKSFTIIGDSISTFSTYIPEGFPYFYPWPTGGVRDVNMTWWMRTINGLGGRLFFNNSYSGSCVADNSTSASKNMSRLEYNLLANQYADVIMIFMGANDCASGYVSVDAFNNGYKQMLDNLKELCPKAEIVLVTLPQSSFYDGDKLTSINNIIRSYASEYHLDLADIASASLDGYKVDSAHPNKDGMKIVADAIIKSLI